MLDVHPPHHPTHTWTDFFIHIATIIVGLLIAVGLEQTVEALHHHHQANELREELHAESEQIRSDALRCIERSRNYSAYFALRINEARAAVWDNKLLPDFQPPTYFYCAAPDIPIWRSAKASGEVGLLTKGERNAYAEVEYVQSHTDPHHISADMDRQKLQQFLDQLPRTPGNQPDLSRMSSMIDKRHYLELLTNCRASEITSAGWMGVIAGAEDAVMAGKTRLEDIYAVERASNAKALAAAGEQP